MIKTLIHDKNGYKAYDIKVCGYDCILHHSTQSGFCLSVPMGETQKEKVMFDNLVYYHKNIYHDKDESTLINKVTKYIKHYE